MNEELIGIIENPDQKQLSRLLERPEAGDRSIIERVERIIEEVRTRGDEALYEYTRTFEKVDLDSLVITEKELQQAAGELSPGLKEAIDRAYRNICSFHSAGIPVKEEVETEPGVLCWREPRPIRSVGIYIPGGSAPLFSTVLMLAAPARLAGCENIVLATPCGADGKVHPAIRYAASICGVTKGIISGGAQAIAALAYGTESVPRVDKIFGPGNRYVMTAKQLVSVDRVAIDMPAGPSEVLVIADGEADPAFLASDLLSQAEHGPDSQVLLVTDDRKLALEVRKEISVQLAALSRSELARTSLAHSSIIVVDKLDSAFDISNSYAPEHLIINMKDADRYIDCIRTAGSVFLGPWTPESAGDYASGTNHTLPTSGWARSYSGVSIESFYTKVTFQRITREGLCSIGPVIETMAAAEGLDAHKHAVSVRLLRAKGVEA